MEGEMDTLGVCGELSIAADNGVVMVKKPGDWRECLKTWTPSRLAQSG